MTGRPQLFLGLETLPKLFALMWELDVKGGPQQAVPLPWRQHNQVIYLFHPDVDPCSFFQTSFHTFTSAASHISMGCFGQRIRSQRRELGIRSFSASRSEVICQKVAAFLFNSRWRSNVMCLPQEQVLRRTKLRRNRYQKGTFTRYVENRHSVRAPLPSPIVSRYRYSICRSVRRTPWCRCQS